MYAPRPQDCDLGFASAAAVRLLEAPLLRRLELASDKVLSARSTLASTRGPLAPRADAASVAGGAVPGFALGFAHLPHAVVRHILSFVPADARARAALVCCAWRDTVADASLWTVLDLSPASGVARPVTDATLWGAAALARGGLTALCLDDCFELSEDALLGVVTESAGSLRELSCCMATDDFELRGEHVEELAAAAPLLASFKVDAKASVAVSTRMLRNEAPFGVLQVRRLYVAPSDEEEEEDDDEEEEEDEDEIDEAQLLAFCSAVSAHESLVALELRDIPLDAPAVMDAVATAAACRLLELRFLSCNLSPASVPPLARLIRSGVLQTFIITNDVAPLLDEAAAAQLADAVAASRTLIELVLFAVCFWDDAAAAASMMRALTGHPHLKELNLSHNSPPDQHAAGAALGALVAANAPALQSLEVWGSDLGDAGCGELFSMLPRNSHLLKLDLRTLGLSGAFVHDIILPAVRANTSLRTLHAECGWTGGPYDRLPQEWLEASELVEARNTAAPEAA